MPAATLPITDQHPRVEYVVTTPANDTFAVPFPLPTDYAQALHVTINGAETTLYTYTPDSEVSGGYPTGVVVLDTAVSNSTVVIFRLNDLDRDTDYGVGPFDYAGINAEFAKTAMRLQDLRLKSAMIWHTGTGAPADATVGLPGDMYIDESTGDVYGPKDFDDTWPASTFSLQGPAGAAGADATGDMEAATYDPAAIAEQLVGLTATQSLTNKTLTTPTLTLKQSAAPTPTAEGDIQWDTDDNTIKVGDGAATKTFSDDSKVFLLANNLSDGVAATMRTNLGLVIGTDVQAYDADLADIAGITPSQGDIIYRNATNWVRLAAGSSGQFLKTLGAGANPIWDTVPGGGDMLAATYDPAAISQQLVGISATQTLTNKTLTTPTITLKQSAAPTPTAEGDIQWDTDDNALKIGDGASTRTFSDDSKRYGSTGVLTGGVLSTGAGASQYSISDGTGIITDEDGTITNVSWSGKTNITPANIATNLLTWVAIDSGGNVVEQTTPFTAAQNRSQICLGVAVHVNKSTVDTVNNEQVVAYQPVNTAYDLAKAIGFINASGNEFSANGANLTLDKSAGVIFFPGSNYSTAADNPHNKTLGALTGLTFQYRYSNGSNGATGTNIDPDNLDDGAGGLTAVSNNHWSIQRIYSFISNNVKIQRGVEEFPSLQAALDGLQAEAYVTEQSIADNGLLRAWLIVKKGATALNGADAFFLQAPKFGEIGASSGTSPKNFADDTFTIFDNADNSKIAAFQASGITTATTRTFTFPDASGTLMLTSAIGVTVQGYDAGLAWLDGLNFSNESTFKAAVNLEPGVDVQAYDADLANIAATTFAQGDIIYRNATQLTNLGAGTSGFVLQTQGAAANPAWARMYGTEQIWVPACAMKPRTTNGCAALATTELATNKVNVETLDFDAAAIEYAQFTLRLPKRYATSTFTATFYWKHASTATNFGVVWGCQAQAFGDGENFESAWGSAQEVTDTGGNTSYQYISSATAAITIANLTAQENVYFQVYRNATSGSDTLAIDAGLVGVLLTFTATQNSDD